MRRSRYENKYTREDIKRMINEVLEIITADCKTEAELSEHIAQARKWADSKQNGTRSIVKRIVYCAVMGSTTFKVGDGISITPTSVNNILKAYKYARRRIKRNRSVLYAILYRNWDEPCCEYTLVSYDTLSLAFNCSCLFWINDAIRFDQRRARMEYQYEAK